MKKKLIFFLVLLFFSNNIFSMIKSNTEENWKEFFRCQNPRNPFLESGSSKREDKSCREKQESEIGDLSFNLVFGEKD
ncbi:hypothetical protein GF385_01910 [Candidatus Dependentiae bacterium]|nr:hypothetical protein [Candidatus Dependentiae bacterium]